ncbi:MAG: hypothetical protein MUC63_06215, partial [Planctomycetes bacterium]|nr:hypothetical protein [Planctomycetota bacterium]
MFLWGIVLEIILHENPPGFTENLPLGEVDPAYLLFAGAVVCMAGAGLRAILRYAGGRETECDESGPGEAAPEVRPTEPRERKEVAAYLEKHPVARPQGDAPFCRDCGAAWAQESKFCGECGLEAGAPPRLFTTPKLRFGSLSYRSSGPGEARGTVVVSIADTSGKELGLARAPSVDGWWEFLGDPVTVFRSESSDRALLALVLTPGGWDVVDLFDGDTAGSTSFRSIRDARDVL